MKKNLDRRGTPANAAQRKMVERRELKKQEVASNKLKSEVLVNLASNEYFRSVKKGQLQADIITPVFKDLKGDRYRIISFFAKKARGQMARYIIENGLTDVEDIRGFAVDGYRFNADESTARDWVFTRDEAPAPAGGAA